MEIHFCDLCNESVPETDLVVGKAYRRKGRIICADCDVSMGGGEPQLAVGLTGAPAPSPGAASTGRASALETSTAAALTSSPQRPAAQESGALSSEALVPAGTSSVGGIFVGMLALVFAAVGIWALFGRLEAAETESREARRQLERELRESRRVHDVFEAGLGQLFSESEERAFKREAELRAPVIAALTALRADLGLSLERESEVAAQLRAIGDLLDEQEQDSKGRVDAVLQALAMLEKDLVFYKNRMIEIEETLRSVSARGPAVAGVPGMASQGAGKSWQASLADLRHSNAGLRLDAIYALGETGDKDVIPHLIPMLEDGDLFVRMATARMLEDLQARAAVPALVQALEDEQSAVREAAMVALRRITGKDFRFDPVAPEADRGKRVKAWRDWWKKSGDEFLLGA